MIAAGLMQVIAQEANRAKYFPAFRSLSSVLEGERSTTTLTKPSGTVSGDKLIAGITISEADPFDGAVSAPAGWTLLVKNSITDGAWDSNTHWYWKDAGGSEPANYSWTHPTAWGNALIFAVSDCPAGAPTYSTNIGSGVTATALSVTATRANMLIAYISDSWESDAGKGVPSGSTPTFTERLDETPQFLYLATGVLTTSGETGNKTQTTLNSSGEPWSAILFAF